MAPCPGLLKINCDGAYSDNLKLGIAAFVVRDHIGALVDGNLFFYSCSSPVGVEAKAVLDATLFANLCVSSPIIIESDCKVVVDVITMEASLLHWDKNGMVEAVRDISRKTPPISYSCV